MRMLCAEPIAGKLGCCIHNHSRPHHRGTVSPCCTGPIASVVENWCVGEVGGMSMSTKALDSILMKGAVCCDMCSCVSSQSTQCMSQLCTGMLCCNVCTRLFVVRMSGMGRVELHGGEHIVCTVCTLLHSCSFAPLLWMDGVE